MAGYSDIPQDEPPALYSHNSWGTIDGPSLRSSISRKPVGSGTVRNQGRRSDPQSYAALPRETARPIHPIDQYDRPSAFNETFSSSSPLQSRDAPPSPLDEQATGFPPHAASPTSFTDSYNDPTVVESTRSSDTPYDYSTSTCVLPPTANKRPQRSSPRTSHGSEYQQVAPSPAYTQSLAYQQTPTYQPTEAYQHSQSQSQAYRQSQAYQHNQASTYQLPHPQNPRTVNNNVDQIHYAEPSPPHLRFLGDDKPTFQHDAQGKKGVQEFREIPIDPSEPLPISSLPNWRPRFVRSASTFTTLFIAVVLIFYALLYWRSKYHTYVVKSSPKWDWAFRFGPAFLATIVAEIIGRLAGDLKIILPFMALSSRTGAAIRKQSLAQLTEPTRWRMNFKVVWQKMTAPVRGRFQEPIGFLALYCSVLLIPVQSGLFTTGSGRVTKSRAAEFRAVSIDKLVTVAQGTRLPSIAMDAIYHGQNMSEYKWVYGDLDSPNTGDAGWAGIMPYAPDDSEDITRPATAAESEYWNATTSAIWSSPNCTQVNNISVTASKVHVSGSSRSATDLEMLVQDAEGCVYQGLWTSVSSDQAPSFSNPFLPDGSFALWLTFSNSSANNNSRVLNDCPNVLYKQLIVTGPLAAESLDDFEADENTTGWGAISCEPASYSIKDVLNYQVYPYSQSAGQTVEIKVAWGVVRRDSDGQTNTLKHPLDVNFFENNRIYNATAPGLSRTFWGEPLNNSVSYWDYAVNDSSVRDCGTVKDPLQDWTKSTACMLLRTVTDIWPFLVATTASATALYIPFDDWQKTKGAISYTSSGWYLSGFGLTYTLFFYALVPLILWRERSLEWNIPCLKRKPRNRTGLEGPTSSIAGLASVFRDRSARRLFEGLDVIEADEAVDQSQRRFANTKLLLRRWLRPGHVQGNTPAFIKPEESLKDLEYDEPSVATPTPNLQKLVYGGTPKLLHPGVLFLVLAATAIIVGVVAKFIITANTNSFQMWDSETPPWIHHWKSGVPADIQKLFFHGAPTLTLVIVRLWWETIEEYYRASQPYYALAAGRPGRLSVCLSYMHDFHFVVSLKALKNHHWKLFYVTIVTTLIKIAVVGASGIFSMEAVASHKDEKLPYEQVWRTSTFAENNTDAFQTNLREFALSRAIYGYKSMPGWHDLSYWFPAVSINAPYTMTLAGLISNLTCEIVTTQAQKVNLTDGLTAWDVTMSEGACSGTTWSSACAVPDSVQLSGAVPGDSSCMAWTYLESAQCSGLGAADNGRWWIFGVEGTLADWSIVNISKAVSLLCTPRFYNDTVELHVSTDLDSGGVLLVAEDAPITSEELPRNYWHSPSDPSTDFVSYVSKLFNNTFGNELQVLSNYQYLDYFSMMTVFNQTRSTLALFDPETMITAASETYAAAFALLAGLDLDGDGSTFLLEPTPHANPPIVIAHKLGTLAVVSMVPLYFGVGILCLYGISIFLVWPGWKRRTRLDVLYPANVMTMIYDSELVEMVANCGEKSGFHSLENEQFALGVVRGKSGKMRVGIDVQRNVVPVEREPSSWVFWRPWGK
ncbi:uncharacterized protein BDZ99DRAFT_503391 [Mytilinidion resinicola]|uniref:Uncharacterized protein n=1 Tax=Mytilinidion resinicola TaxID=574789 RepID=A0A6A6Y3M5_9PEZI|nr:uncharacterized protein BDZ99DRAFT_503391 [Mytilinidion resinicola]KAF2803382.1 hypothetical protein BDZ99DRAFT_503391 [Mytilinidion resinicola]